MSTFAKNTQYHKFCAYGFLKNLRFFEAFLVLFLVEKGLSFTQIGLLYALREVVTNLMEVPSGLLADTYGRRKTLAASFLVYQASFLLFYGSDGLWWLGAAFVLYGLGDAFRSGTHKGMIMDYLARNGWSDQKINYYGHTRAWSHRGSALSAILAGIIVFFYGQLHAIFLFALLPYALNFFLLLSYPSWMDQPLEQQKKPRLGQVFADFWAALKSPGVLQILNNSALHSAYLKGLKDFIQPMIQTLALSLPLLLVYSETQRTALFVGAIYGLIYSLSVGASLLAGRAYANHTPGYRTTLDFAGIGPCLGPGLRLGFSYGLGRSGHGAIYWRVSDREFPKAGVDRICC